jgi:glycine/D-amino acid oxidase-like deaminating enzyme
VIALSAAEERRLTLIHERARANNVPVHRLIGPPEIAELEPHAVGSRALHTPKAAIVDSAAITRAFAQDVNREGGRIDTGTQVDAIETRGDVVAVATTAGRFRFDRLVVCAGLIRMSWPNGAATIRIRGSFRFVGITWCSDVTARPRPRPYLPGARPPVSLFASTSPEPSGPCPGGSKCDPRFRPRGVHAHHAQRGVSCG